MHRRPMDDRDRRIAELEALLAAAEARADAAEARLAAAEAALARALEHVLLDVRRAPLSCRVAARSAIRW